MPELPDVEVYKQYIDRHALHHEIRHVEIIASKVVQPSRRTLNNYLKNSHLDESKRVGKYLLIHARSEKWLLLHFGMTGSVEYFPIDGGKPTHSPLILHFDNDHALAIQSKRKFGRIDLESSPEDFIATENIGPDALTINQDRFLEIFGDKKGMIKPAFMNQKLISGPGNIYVDEILFQTKIHPRENLRDLSENRLKTLYQKMGTILKTAIRRGARPGNLPEHYLVQHRTEGESCPACGGNFRKISVNGRSTYICENCQSISH